MTVLSPDGEGATYRRSEVMNTPFTEAGGKILVENYWPDFAMENGRPVTKSELANNPAILVKIEKLAGSADGKPSLDVAVSGAGIDYQLLRGGQVVSSGREIIGGKFALGWADWQAEVANVLPHATLVTKIVPGPPLEKGAVGVPGFRAHLVDAEGKKGPDAWIESGQVVTLSHGSIFADVGYGLETRPLPFSMRLVKFDVPRDEGTDTPSNFLATIEFRDDKTGATRTGVAQMNRPATYPGTFLSNVTGLNYKFSQAEWNPRT